jgi:amino acid transporter
MERVPHILSSVYITKSLVLMVRMTYAFSRDGAMPLSSVWHKVNKNEVPINAVWLSAFISLCMALPVNDYLAP